MRNNKLDLHFAGWLWAVNRNKVNEYYRGHYSIGNDFKPSIGGVIVKEYFNTNAELLQNAYYFLQIKWNHILWDTYPETSQGYSFKTKTLLDVYDFTWLLFLALAHQLKVDDINELVEGDWRSLWRDLDKEYSV